MFCDRIRQIKNRQMFQLLICTNKKTLDEIKYFHRGLLKNTY